MPNIRVHTPTNIINFKIKRFKIMEFKKRISCDDRQKTYWLCEPITINYDEIFVKIKFWHPSPKHDNRVQREIIINYNLISSGE